MEGDGNSKEWKWQTGRRPSTYTFGLYINPFPQGKMYIFDGLLFTDLIKKKVK